MNRREEQRGNQGGGTTKGGNNGFSGPTQKINFTECRSQESVIIFLQFFKRFRWIISLIIID